MGPAVRPGGWAGAVDLKGNFHNRPNAVQASPFQANPFQANPFQADKVQADAVQASAKPS